MKESAPMLAPRAASPDRLHFLHSTGYGEAAAQNQAQIRLYAVAWENSHPDRKIETIDVVSKDRVRPVPDCHHPGEEVIRPMGRHDASIIATMEHAREALGCVEDAFEG